MKTSPIRIGPISLTDFEVPASVRFGGRHRVAVQHLADGNRIVESLGPDDGEISFGGIFSGPNAEARVRAFDSLRLSGAVVWLAWESFKRRVIVRNFVAEYHGPSWIPYQVSCLVVDQAGVKPSQTSAVAASILADLSFAVAQASGSPIQMATLQAALAQQNAFADGTQDHSQAVIAVAASLNAFDSQIAQQTDAMLGTPPSNASRGQLGTSFNSIVDCAGSLAGAVSARSYVGRIGVNLNGITF